jgi:hypothetical protein
MSALKIPAWHIPAEGALNFKGGASAIDRQHIHRRRQSLHLFHKEDGRKPKAPIMTQSSIATEQSRTPASAS